MENKISIYLLLIFISISFSSFTQENRNLFIKNYSIKETKSGILNWAVIQDTNDILYFGNENNIITYNGNKWDKIQLPQNLIARSLAINNKGVIYVGSVNELGYLEPDSLGKQRYISLLNKIKKEYRNFQDIWFTKCIHNDVWFSSYNYLFRLRNGKIKTWQLNNITNSFFNLIEYNNNIYIYNLFEGINKVTEDSLILMPGSDFFKNKRFWTLQTWGKNKALIFTFTHGLFTYNFIEAQKGNKNKIIQKIYTQADSILLKNRPYCSIKLKNGNIAIGTLSGGLVIINNQGELIKHFTDKTELGSNVILDLLEDNEENLWIATTKGISKININTPFNHWGEKFGMSGAFNQIIKLQDKIFISRYEGVYTVKNNNITKIKGLNTPAFNILEFKNPEKPGNNIILAATNLKGLVEIKNDSIKELLPKLANIISLIQSKKDPSILYIGTIHTLNFARYSNKKWNYLGVVDGLKGEAWDIIEDNNGDIWTANRNKEIKYIKQNPKNLLQTKEIKTYNIGESTFEISTFYKKDNKILISNSNGLFTYSKQKDKFVHDTSFPREIYNGNIYITNINKDKKNNTIISGTKENKPIITIIKNNGAYQYYTKPFGILPEMKISQTFVEKDTSIWIGGSEGLFKFKANLEKQYPGFKTLIHQIIINNDSTILYQPHHVNISENPISLPYKYNSITFKYTATTFSDESRTLYQTYLEGFDKDWQYWTPDTKKEYNYLPPGEYTMQIKAKNIYNVLGEEAVFSFEILPPWYKTILAYIIYSIMLGLFIWLIVFLNAKRLKTLNLELEKTVEKRTKDLHEVNTQLEEKQAELEVQQEELIAQRDHTLQQKKIIEQQNTELEKLSIVASETDNAITIMDAKGNFIWFNQAYKNLYGYNIEEFRKIKGQNIFSVSSKKNITELINHCIKNKKPVQYESEIISRTGKKIWTQVTISPILDKNNNITKLISIESGIEKLKQYEKEIIAQKDSIEIQNKELEKHRNHLDKLVKERTIELEKAKQKAEESDRLKSSFLANMSHEIRTPMNAIMGFSDLITDPDIEQEDKEDLSERITQNCNSLMRLIDDIIDISKIESNQLNIIKKEFNAIELMNEINSIYKLRSNELQKDKLEFTIKENINNKTVIKSDKIRIRQILINLLDNAFKFTEKGNIECGYKLEKNKVKFFVKDTGIGLTPEQTKEIFNQFRKIETHKSTVYRGAGLGLAISKNLVQLLGGKIWVESSLSKGSTFLFTIPKR